MSLGRNVVSREDAAWCLERFDWLIENFCPQYGPLRASLTCVKDGALMLEPGSVHIDSVSWAIACFEAVRHQAGMGHWPVDFVALDKKLPARSTDKELAELVIHSGNIERYYTNELGHPVIYFEPERINERGYIARRAATMLASLLHSSVKKPVNIRRDSSAQINAVTAAFLGLGLPMATHNPDIEAPDIEIEAKIGETESGETSALSLFACAIFLSLKGYDGPRAARLYDGLIDAADMRRLQDSFAQLRQYKAEISRLRNLAMMAEQTDVERTA